MLSQAAVEAATPRTCGYTIAGGGGLSLHVSPTGTKSWRLKVRFARRERLLTLGRFPALDLAAAEARRESCKSAIREGRDPSSEVLGVNTFEQLARAWWGHNRESWSEEHAAGVIASLTRDVFPIIGAMKPGAIGAPALLQLIGRIEKRGCLETARRVRQRLSEIFAFGIVLELVTRDPAERLGAAMKSPPPPRPQPALTSIEDCRALLERCELDAARPSTRLASRFLALTAVRLDAVRGMRWEELLRQVQDGRELWTWTVPASRMKLGKAKKGEARFDHVVPLSAAAIAVITEARLLVVDDKQIGSALVFPGSMRDKEIGEGAIGALYDRCGCAGRHVPHGWRAAFSTILNDDLGEDWARTIDRALAHSPKDRVEAAYNRAQLLDRRRAVFDRWGELLAD